MWELNNYNNNPRFRYIKTIMFTQHDGGYRLRTDLTLEDESSFFTKTYEAGWNTMVVVTRQAYVKKTKQKRSEAQRELMKRGGNFDADHYI